MSIFLTDRLEQCISSERAFVFFFRRMDSFFLAEMFKYLYLLFADKEDMIFDIEDYIFTTEAHLLPLWLSTTNQTISKKNTVSNNSDFHQFWWCSGAVPFFWEREREREWNRNCNLYYTVSDTLMWTVSLREQWQSRAWIMFP